MTQSKRQALIVIDVQNDYFPEGRFPLWNTATVLATTEAAIASARARDIPIIIVQHVADGTKGPAPFFNAGTPGVAVHPAILAAAPDAPVIIKTAADAFLHTQLEATLTQLGVEELLICGMMTQNCVTHTAISRAADKYAVKVLGDCCTTVSQMLHLIALNALSARIGILTSTEIFSNPGA
ncbi:cysteine hydrolase family protein [Azonexus sp.]|uniref:cysteine hydrolase family protein n=1 Tax=Azonexus sp. TaxID=1872668 RepID=UPI0027BA8902|nr:cysteine hydrolase family protein [Azonexus sp.]